MAKKGEGPGGCPGRAKSIHVEEGPQVEGFPSVCGGGGETACWKADSDVGQ